MSNDAEDKVARIVLQELTGKEKGVFFVRLRREITENHPSIPPQQVFRSVSQLIESRDVSFTPAGALALTGVGMVASTGPDESKRQERRSSKPVTNDQRSGFEIDHDPVGKVSECV